MTTGTSPKAAVALTVDHPTQATSLESTSATTTYHRVTVDGVGVFYREVGQKDAPTIVLLHGFPSSSREFDTLIPPLATRYHLIAPDFPGFGQSDAPPPSSYAYTFDNLAKTINGLLDQLKINKYSFYFHDYGGPVGFRIISAHPERLQALIIQNANAYKEGLGAKWAGIAQYWADPKAHSGVLDAFVSLTATEQRHTLGTSHPERYNPDTWTDEYAHLSRPGQREIQADLLFDYRTDVASYPAWQAWLPSTEMTALAFDVGFTLNIRHSFDSSARQFRAMNRPEMALTAVVTRQCFQTVSATEETNSSLRHCWSSVSGFPRPDDAKPHCGLSANCSTER